MASVQLDAFSEATLSRLAERRGQSWAEVLRDALRRFAEEEEAQPSAYDRLRSFVGCADSGGQQLSEQTGRRFREQLEGKQRASRTG